MSKTLLGAQGARTQRGTPKLFWSSFFSSGKGEQVWVKSSSTQRTTLGSVLRTELLSLLKGTTSAGDRTKVTAEAATCTANALPPAPISFILGSLQSALQDHSWPSSREYLGGWESTQGQSCVKT